MVTSLPARGFSLLELLIVITLVILLFTIAVNRLAPLRGEAEAAHVAAVVGSLHSAIGMEAAYRVVREGMQGLVEMEGINPMALLQKSPQQYVGIRDAGDPNDVPDGSWYFDQTNNRLIYRVRFPQYLASSPTAPVELQWQVQLQFDDLSESGDFDPEQDRIRGLGLRPMHVHQWAVPQTSGVQTAATD